MAFTLRIAGAAGLLLLLGCVLVALVFDLGDSLGAAAAMGVLLVTGAAVGMAVREFTAIQETHQRPARPLDPDTCHECGYDLARLPSDRCPECGTARPVTSLVARHIARPPRC